MKTIEDLLKEQMEYLSGCITEDLEIVKKIRSVDSVIAASNRIESNQTKLHALKYLQLTHQKEKEKAPKEPSWRDSDA